MNIHFVIHVAGGIPGAITRWADERGHRPSYSRVYASEPLPVSVEDIDMLIVMGGPQSPTTTKEESPTFDGPAEMALIRRCIEAGKAVVGICLGAQLLGSALGGRHEPSPHREIGIFPITTTAEGRADPHFAHLGQGLMVAHWHNDMPGLTPNATIIAQSAACPRQIIRYDTLAYGIQCHMEMTPELLENFLRYAADEWEAPHDRDFVQDVERMRAQDWAGMNEALGRFLDSLAEAYAERRVALA